MSDRIIDFNELRNKAKEKDVDKLEEYMYTLYYEMAEGKITMAEFTQNIYKYMEKNNISQDKFLNIQKKLMERYGFDPSNIEEQLKLAGLNIGGAGTDYETIRKTMSFHEKYKDKIKTVSVDLYMIKNEKNNVDIILSNDKVTLQSSLKIDMNDLELNEFLCSYKKIRDEKPLSITICENINRYDY